MTVIKPWVSALKISESDFTSWQSSVPSTIPATFWCLEKGKIPVVDYLKWARDHYGLAVLKDSYFEEKPDFSFWNQIQTVANWSPHLLPLTQWDGIVFVACVEPQEDVQWSFPVRYLLASPKSLQKRWKDLQAGEKAPTLNLPPVPASNLPPPLPKVETSMDLKSLPEEPSAPVLSAAPEGLSLDLNKTSGNSLLMDAPLGLNLQSSVPETGSVAETPSIPADSEAPEGLSYHTSVTKLRTAQTSAAISAPHLADKNQEEIPTGVHDVANAGTTTVGTDLTGVMQNLIGEDQEAVIDTAGAPSRVEEASSEKSLIAWAFTQLKDHFDQSMILLFEGSGLKPWKWETQWEPQNGKSLQAFNIDSPNLFRIVKRTNLPYHGPLVESATHREFFENWGFKELPAHVTAVPLKSSSHLTGIILCIKSSEAGPQSLSAAERTSERLFEALARLPKAA